MIDFPNISDLYWPRPCQSFYSWLRGLCDTACKTCQLTLRRTYSYSNLSIQMSSPWDTEPCKFLKIVMQAAAAAAICTLEMFSGCLISMRILIIFNELFAFNKKVDVIRAINYYYEET